MATVLVVDDVALNREIAHALLGGHGYDVVEASTGFEALEIAHRLHPDVLVTDVLMPGMDGYELVHELRAEPDIADTPVVFFTANYLQAEAQPLADACGVTQVVLRSEEPQRLLDAVEDALVHHRVAPTLLPAAAFDQHHAQTVNNKLISKVRDLHASEERFRAIAESSPVGIAFTAPDGAAYYTNPRLAEILDQPAAHQGQHAWLENLPTELADYLTAAIQTEQPAGNRHRARIVTVPGEIRWLDALVQHTRDADGTRTGAVVMLDDVTAPVQAEEHERTATLQREHQARQHLTDRLDSLSRMAGSVAHEFNNILGSSQPYLAMAIETLTTTITDGGLDPATGKAILDDLASSQRCARRASDVCQQLLAFGRHEIIQPADHDLNDLIREMTTPLSAVLPTNVDLQLNLTPVQLPVHVDSRQLLHALRHLVTNAGQAMTFGAPAPSNPPPPSPTNPPSRQKTGPATTPPSPLPTPAAA